VKDLLPTQFDESGAVPVDDEEDGDADDWTLPQIFDDDRPEAAKLFRQRGLCANELDVTASVTDFAWLFSSYFIDDKGHCLTLQSNF